MILKRYESYCWRDGFDVDHPTIRRWTLKGALADKQRNLRVNLTLLDRWDLTVWPHRKLPPDEFSLQFARSLRGSIVDRRTGEVVDQYDAFAPLT